MCRQSDRRRGTALWNGQLSEELTCERDLEGEVDCHTEVRGNNLLDQRRSETSLVVQGLSIYPMGQETQVQALVREDPTCCRAAKPVRHAPRACALQGQEHHSGKATHHHATGVALLALTGAKPAQQRRPSMPTTNKQIILPRAGGRRKEQRPMTALISVPDSPILLSSRGRVYALPCESGGWGTAPPV